MGMNSRSYEYVLALADPGATLETVGGKGASLARLSKASLPVPHGFHVTTAAYQEFVTVNNLQPFILETLKDLDISHVATLESASRAIQDRFAQGRMPDGIAQAITQAYEDLPGEHPVVAVRSSATAEDLPGLSFAGQQETFLNIHGLENVLEAVQRCWASLWTGRAIAYRLQHGIDQDKISLAVVVQILVHAEVSGILFTADPVTGRRDQAMITASWGLGESIVGGLVNPDIFTVDQTSGRVTSREIADKELMTVLLESSTAEHPVPETMRRVPALSDTQTVELAKLGAQIERLYQMPMDIEWARAEGRFYILQARPVTTLLAEPHPTEPIKPVEANWDIPDPHARFARGSVADFLPDPLSPLFDTLGKPLYNVGLNRMIDEIAGKETGLAFSLVTLNGYAYMGTNINARFLLRFGSLLIRKMAWLVRTAERRWREEALPQYAAVVSGWQDRPVEQLSSIQLVTGVNELMQETFHYLGALQSGILGTAGLAEGIFSTVYEKLARREGDPPASSFVIGYDSIPIQAEKALFDFAGRCREHPSLAGYLLDVPTPQLAACLEAGCIPITAPPKVENRLWVEWLGRMRAYLQQYGHSLYDLDFCKPVPADEPAPILETFKLYLTGGGRDPYQRQSELARRREQAVQNTSSRLKGLRLKLFQKALHFAQTYAPLREDCIADIGLGYPLLRQMLLELGRRFTSSGLISQPADIYWLEINEVNLAMGELDEGRPVSCLDEQVRERKALWEAQKRLTPPPMLPVKSRIAGINMEKWLPVDASQQTGEVIKGVGASPGRVTGAARVLLGPQEFHQMQPGDILVAAITTPAWTPLFAMASAVVTDIGGPLSHGSIVAREYGIPAVLGTGVATRRICSGQVITVDGSSGIVTLEAGERTPKEAPAPTHWELPNPKAQYMRGSIADLAPGPLSPLYISIGLPAITDRGIKRVMKAFTGSDPVLPDNYITAINGYAYTEITFTPRQWWWIFRRMILGYFRILRMGIPFWRDEMLPSYRAAVHRWESRTFTEMAPAELLSGSRELVEMSGEYIATLLMATTGASAGSEGLFTKVYEKMLKRNGDPPASAFLMGYDSLPVQAEKSLYDLAEWPRTSQQLSAYLMNTRTPAIISAMESGSQPAEVAAGEWSEFLARFDTHLERYGYAIFTIDFGQPLPCDNPAPMIEAVKMYLRGEGTNPHKRQQAAAQKRQRSVDLILGRSKGLRRWAFQKALNWAQSLAEVREDAIAYIGLGYPLARRMLGELGRRLVAAGCIEQAGDVFWLKGDELADMTSLLEAGKPLPGLGQRVRDRKVYQAQMKTLTPPPVLPEGRKKVLGINISSFLPTDESSQKDTTLKGIGACSGKVTAPARVLHGPEDFDQMLPGDILVADTTTPAWTPLFAMASGVVTDVGGPLSHGSIVAREYGIPAVMGTGVATKRIRSGQVITVDGTAGLVTLSSNGSGNGRQAA